MQRRVYSFSLAPQDKEANQLIAKIQTECKAKGVSFSYTVLKALKLLQENQNEC